jgi:hypothetical protein
MADCFLTAAQRSDPEQQNPAIPGCSPKENPFFPVKSGKRRVMQRFKILFSCEDSGGDSGELINISSASG